VVAVQVHRLQPLKAQTEQIQLSRVQVLQQLPLLAAAVAVLMKVAQAQAVVVVVVAQLQVTRLVRRQAQVRKVTTAAQVR
tara:strand:+ start:428 stop:667 length:240 start_codon:yes stop_codon:yes gene_type:complete